jgi:hypothetical protein
MYGTIVDLSLGGVRMCLKGDLDAKRVELSPKKALPSGMAVIPLPYDVRWQDGEEAILAGLQFAGGTDAFFRGWLSDQLTPLLGGVGSLLDHRKLVRLPCQLEGRLTTDEGKGDCAVLDVSLGGLSFVAEGELLPGMSVQIVLHEQEGLGTLELILLRVQSLSGHSLCGGKFLGLSDTQNDSLQRLLAELAENAKSSILSGD